MRAISKFPKWPRVGGGLHLLSPESRVRQREKTEMMRAIRGITVKNGPFHKNAPLLFPNLKKGAILNKPESQNRPKVGTFEHFGSKNG